MAEPEADTTGCSTAQCLDLAETVSALASDTGATFVDGDGDGAAEVASCLRAVLFSSINERARSLSTPVRVRVRIGPYAVGEGVADTCMIWRPG